MKNVELTGAMRTLMQKRIALAVATSAIDKEQEGLDKKLKDLLPVPCKIQWNGWVFEQRKYSNVPRTYLYVREAPVRLD